MVVVFFLERKEEFEKAMKKIARCMRDLLREDKAKQTRFAFSGEQRQARSERSTGVGASHVGRVSCLALLACFALAVARLKNANK